MTYSLDDLHPRLRVQIRASNVPVRFLGLEFDDLDEYAPGTLDAARKWMGQVSEGRIIRAVGQRSCGKGLLLHGKPGMGKTALSCAIIQDLIRNMPAESWSSGDRRLDRPAYFASYPKILSLLKAQMDDDDSADRILGQIYGEDQSNAVRLLVIDDLGKEYRNANRWAETQFDHLLRGRFDQGWPTIVSTNVPLSDWSVTYGEAMGSFAHESFYPLAIMSVEGDRRMRQR